MVTPLPPTTSTPADVPTGVVPLGSSTGSGFDQFLRSALASPQATGQATAGRPAASAAPDTTLTLGQMLQAWGGGAAPAVARALTPVAETAPAQDHRGHATSAIGEGRVRPLGGEAGSGFGPRVHPVHGDVRDHAGIDVGAPTGTPIVAAQAGEVVFAGPRGGYGNLVIVDHGGGVTTRYAHASAFDVAVGDRVEAGTTIARVGATGTATGPHLHFEVRHDGVAVDPETHGWW